MRERSSGGWRMSGGVEDELGPQAPPLIGQDPPAGAPRRRGSQGPLGRARARRGATGCPQGLDLEIGARERVALMGRNGAGKSTLLRTLAGLVEPVRGKLQTPGGMALLTQNPGDYLVRERVGDELPGEQGRTALEVVGLEHAIDADPRDLSGGERQRLALAIASRVAWRARTCRASSRSTSRPGGWTAPARTTSSS